MSDQDYHIGCTTYEIYQQPGAPVMHTTPTREISEEEELSLLLEESRLSSERSINKKRKQDYIQDKINKKKKYMQEKQDQEYQENQKLIEDHELNISPHVLEILE